MLCAAFGEVAKITMFEKTGGLQVRSQVSAEASSRQPWRWQQLPSVWWPQVAAHLSLLISSHGARCMPTDQRACCCLPACLQALVQFHDPRHAREAQQLLDGSSIPDHLVPQHPGKISMKVSFSAHADLTIRSQGARSR